MPARNKKHKKYFENQCFEFILDGLCKGLNTYWYNDAILVLVDAGGKCVKLQPVFALKTLLLPASSEQNSSGEAL
jgi:hypothetical protein